MASSKPGLFAREATGLVREIGFTLGVIIILSHVVGLGWQKRAFQFTGPRPVPTNELLLGLPAIFWAFFVCGIIVLITGYASGYVTAAMPRSGGGYVTISRVTHPILGYMSGWLMFLAEGFSYGLIGVACFEAIGIFYNIALAPEIIGWANDPVVLFIGGLAVVWIFAIIALLGTKLYGRLMHVLFWIPAIITIAFFAMWIAGAMDPSLTATGVQEVMSTTELTVTPGYLMNLAVDSGMTATENISDFYGAFSFALAGAFWAYMGWYSTTFVAGEVKEANKKLPKVVVMAGLIIMLVYLAASSASAFSTMNVPLGPEIDGAYYTDAAGNRWDFFQAYSWLSYGGVDWTALGVPADVIEAGTQWDYLNVNFQSAWSTGIASLVARGMNLAWLSWIIALAGVLWLANDIPPFLLVASRTFFAMSFDRMLPESFAYVSEKWHAPVWSIIITAVAGIFGCIAEVEPLLGTSYFAFAGVVGTDIFDAFFLTMFCLSCMLLPLERREIYDRAAVRHSIGTVVFLGLVATLLSGYCLYTFVSESLWIFKPGPDEIYSTAGFFLCIIIGVLLYIYHLYKNTTRGIDVRTLYMSIPPE